MVINTKVLTKRLNIFIVYCIFVWLVSLFNKPIAYITMVLSFFITVWYFYSNYNDIIKQFDKQTGIMSGITKIQMEGGKEWEKLKKPKIMQKWYKAK
jgi:uncharacterized protein YacL